MACYNEYGDDMYKILKNEPIGEKIYLLEVEAPLVVKNCLPGQFVIVMANEDSERIPLTIYDYNRETSILSMIYQVVGSSTLELTKKKESLFSVAGPLGKPSEVVTNIEEYKGKKIVMIGGGVGIAPVYPQAKYFKNHGLSVDIIYGAKNKDLLIILEELKSVCDHLVVVTDDGSNGKQGLVTDALKEYHDYDLCIVMGSTIMMKFVCNLTKELNIKTIASMNPIMVDGTGMCGACRLLVGNEVKFACVDGPEFDGHLVDFDAAIKRMNLYKEEEGRRYLKDLEGDTHSGGCGICGDK